MNTYEHELLDGIVARVVGAAYEVSNVLGAGFFERVYERALIQELESRGLEVKSQVAYPVVYKAHALWKALSSSN